jgi:hypothetical protein
MIPDLNAPEREEVDLLVYECEVEASDRRAFMAEIVRMRQVIATLRHYYRRLPAVVQHQVEGIPRQNVHAEFRRLVADSREELELTPPATRGRG